MCIYLYISPEEKRAKENKVRDRKTNAKIYSWFRACVNVSVPIAAAH